MRVDAFGLCQASLCDTVNAVTRQRSTEKTKVCFDINEQGVESIITTMCSNLFAQRIHEDGNQGVPYRAVLLRLPVHGVHPDHDGTRHVHTLGATPENQVRAMTGQ